MLSLVHGNMITLSRLIESLTSKPAELLGTRAPSGLGTLAKGAPADVVLINTEHEWIVDPRHFTSKGRNTPLAGTTLKGRAMATIYAGRLISQPPTEIVN